MEHQKAERQLVQMLCKDIRGKNFCFLFLQKRNLWVTPHLKELSKQFILGDKNSKYIYCQLIHDICLLVHCY